MLEDVSGNEEVHSPFQVCIDGAKIKFWKDNTPSEYHTLYHIEDLDRFPEYEVENDAFMAMTLHRIRMQRQRILDTGEILPLVTSRGPLCTAGFVRNTTDFMIDLVEKPEWAHKLIARCTSLIIDWLKAQAKIMGDTVEGIFILDDIVGFINEEHYQEFAHPYLKKICDAFPTDWVKIYHNDAEIDACLDHLPDCGFNVLNWGKQKDIAEVKERVGDRMCLRSSRRAVAKESFFPSGAAPVRACLARTSRRCCRPSRNLIRS